MKKYNYDDLADDTHVCHSWEPLKFELKDNYKYINNNVFFKFFSNILTIPIGFILVIIDKIFLGYKIDGKEKIVKDSGLVSISNHVHLIDCTIIGLIYYPRRVYYPTLQTNFKIPVVRHLIKILYGMPIPTRDNQKKEFYKQINGALRDKKIIHMYPEGSLWPYYEGIRKFKHGAFKMAVDANVPIQPVKLVFREPRGIYKLYKRKKCLHAVIMDPIYPNSELDYRERIEDLKERTHKVLEEEIK